MAQKVVGLLLTVICICIITRADKHERVWQTGTVLDTGSESFTTYGGTTTQGHVDDNGNVSATSTRSSWSHKRETVAIEGEEYIYVVSHVLSWRWSKEIKLVVGATLEYAIDGDKLILRDSKAREFKMHIDKTILKKKPVAVSSPQVNAQVITTPEIPNYSLVVVKSEPAGSEITVDNKYVGNTPSTIRMTSGEHTISLVKDGFKPWQRSMTVNAGGNISIDANLEKIP